MKLVKPSEEKNKLLLTESTNSIVHIKRLIIQRYIDILIIKLLINENLSKNKSNRNDIINLWYECLKQLNTLDHNPNFNY